MPRAQFHIYTPQQFKDYITNSNFGRKITVIQNHHTWKPSYASLTDTRDEMYWLEGMRADHINTRKWSDIGQNITTFKNGNIGLCRPIDTTPAGIYGANTGAICIEHMGNFDAGQDVMTPEHTDAIILLNAVLCMKFGLSPVKSQVVYHHWYDTSGKRFTDERINSGATKGLQKTCPGTAFFGGNKISDAEANFYPLINAKMQELKSPGAAPPATITKTVSANVLNVRSGPGTTFGIVRKLAQNNNVNVYTERNGWSKISNTAEEWVFSQLIS